MTIYLVRHTKYFNPNNIYPFHLPVYLSKEGREHAKEIADWYKDTVLPGIPIYSSPIARCVQTSEIIASKTKSFVSLDDRLIESYCPSLQGKKQAEIDAWRVEEDESSRESRESVLKRALNIFNEKMQEEKDCIFVSHGDPTTMLFYYLRNKELPKHLWNPKNSKEVVNKGSTIKIIIKKKKVFKVEKINDYGSTSS